jgi:hypothetical protein
MGLKPATSHVPTSYLNFCTTRDVTHNSNIGSVMNDTNFLTPFYLQFLSVGLYYLVILHCGGMLYAKFKINQRGLDLAFLL